MLATINENPLDEAALQRLEKLGGVELLVRVINQFLENIPARMESACERGMAGDLKSLGGAVHAIQDAAGNIGATAVFELAGRIEALAVEGAREFVLPLLCQLDGMLEQVDVYLRREKLGLTTAAH